MNKRQKKKAFKKKYGFNPPKGVPVLKAEQIIRAGQAIKAFINSFIKVWKLAKTILAEIVDILNILRSKANESSFNLQSNGRQQSS